MRQSYKIITGFQRKKNTYFIIKLLLQLFIIATKRINFRKEIRRTYCRNQQKPYFCNEKNGEPHLNK